MLAAINYWSHWNLDWLVTLWASELLSSSLMGRLHGSFVGSDLFLYRLYRVKSSDYYALHACMQSEMNNEAISETHFHIVLTPHSSLLTPFRLMEHWMANGVVPTLIDTRSTLHSILGSILHATPQFNRHLNALLHFYIFASQLCECWMMTTYNLYNRLCVHFIVRITILTKSSDEAIAVNTRYSSEQPTEPIRVYPSRAIETGQKWASLRTVVWTSLLLCAEYHPCLLFI